VDREPEACCFSLLLERPDRRSGLFSIHATTEFGESKKNGGIFIHDANSTIRSQTRNGRCLAWNVRELGGSRAFQFRLMPAVTTLDTCLPSAGMKRPSSPIVNDPDHAQPASQSAFCWSAHPAREQPGRAAVGGIWIIAVAAVVYATTFNIFWPAFAVIFLLAALNRFFFPSRYIVDEEGITATSLLRWQRMRWADVKRFVHDEHGGLLSDRPVPSRLDAYRGVHVLFGREGSRVVRAIEERLRAVRSDEHSDCRESTTEAGGIG
jgi:hypothetical protein